MLSITAGIPASRTVHVGNRLESDIRPAQAVGNADRVAVARRRSAGADAGPTGRTGCRDHLAVGLPTALSRLTGSRELSHSSGSVASLES